MRSLRGLVLSALAVALLAPAGVYAEPSDSETAPSGDSEAVPLVIGHRGASGYRPEHTLAAYRLAAEQGAHFIEVDLVATKDGVLVARDENEIGVTTDVAQHREFASRRTTRVIDGVTRRGWFTEDFTLAELKRLRANERIPRLRPQNIAYNGRFTVPTFQEVLDLRERLTRELGRPIGVYPETRHPSHFRSIGLPLEKPLVRMLNRSGLNRRDAPVFVASAEPGNLRALDRALRVPLVQLLGAKDARPIGDDRRYAELASRTGLASIARYADGVGPSKDYIVPREADGRSATATSFVADAHAAGLVVHPHTFGRENAFLPLELRSSGDPAGIGDLESEVRQFIELGIDGFLTDNPDIGIAATRTTIAVIGDTPYGSRQLAVFPADVAAINDDARISLVVHVGDVKNGTTPCTDAYFAQIRAAFDVFEDPLVYTPGDNEWTDCHRAAAGGYLPTRRLARLRKVFFHRSGGTLGRDRRDVRVQHGHPENVRFTASDVQFATVHIVGSNDNRAPWFVDRVDASGRPLPERRRERVRREAEVSARQAANLEWIDRVFRAARKTRAAAVALAIHADMWDSAASDLSGFDAYKRRLAKRARAFGEPVLVLNGDSHVYTADRPLPWLPNLSRITVNGSDSCPHEYLRLSIDLRSAGVFAHERVPLPSSAGLCPA